MDDLRVLLVGVGNMGLSHGRAYDKIPGFKIVGLCSRGILDRNDLPATWSDIPRYAEFHEALRATRPDVVSINTWPNTHAEFSLAALKAGAHVFVEKPLAETVADAEKVVETAKSCKRKLVIGYSMPHLPMWQRVTEVAKTLGKPLVMRMNLNQQSVGPSWTWHKNLLASLSPIVDCGVHYVDAMCQMTGARPVRVNAMGARLSDDIAPDQYNYGQLQVFFDDGSVGWYEAAWGPSVSETAFMIKDIMGPKGSISIVPIVHRPNTPAGASWTLSSDIDTHGQMEEAVLHRSELNEDLTLRYGDEIISVEDIVDHDEICVRIQKFFLDAIRNDSDLTAHMHAAIDSLKVVLAADESIKKNKSIEL